VKLVSWKEKVGCLGFSDIRLKVVAFASAGEGLDNSPPCDSMDNGEDYTHAEENPADIECHAPDAPETESDGDESDDE